MRLRRKFLASIVVIHCAFVVLSIFLLNESRYLFVAAEALIIVSLAISIYLYRALLKPIDLMSSGVESIKDRDFNTTLIATGHEELDKLIDVYNRMIDQLRSERVKQREQHYFLERLIRASPVGVIVLDLDDNVTAINPAAESMLGVTYDDVIGLPLASIKSHPGSELKTLKAGGATIVGASGVQTLKCRRSQFVDRGFHRHFILIEELTKDILVTQKNAYEKVIRMMSHEINNSVGAVNSILESSMNYKDQLSVGDREDFEEAIQVAIDRNSGLNNFMSNLADVVRVPPPVMETYDLHELLRTVQMLMSAECERHNIEWVWDTGEAPLAVKIDVHQIEQVLMNIAKNAVEAIGNDGTITVSTNVDGSKVLRIYDDGKGIAPVDRSHLFTPFYSTKKDGQGIGLTLIREILVNHGFAFNLEPTDNGRTVFWIEFGP